MGFSVLRCFEYVAECDMCGVMDVMHTGDVPTVDGQSIYVHDTQSAIKGFQFHRTKNGFICDDCYKKIAMRTRLQ
jgi:hypothetical protein